MITLVLVKVWQNPLDDGVNISIITEVDLIPLQEFREGDYPLVMVDFDIIEIGGGSSIQCGVEIISSVETDIWATLRTAVESEMNTRVCFGESALESCVRLGKLGLGKRSTAALV